MPRKPLKFRGEPNRRGRKFMKMVRKKIAKGIARSLQHYIGKPCPQTITFPVPPPLFEVTITLPPPKDAPCST